MNQVHATVKTPEQAVDADFDETFVRSALAQANMNVLRLAVLQMTNDPELAEVPVIETDLRGGALINYAVPPEYYGLIQEKAFQYLKTRPSMDVPKPSHEDAERLMQAFVGRELDRANLDYGYEELSVEEFPRDVRWSGEVPVEKLANFRVGVIGAGISGVASALFLSRLGIKFELYEKQPDVGGVWLNNNYPECRVDTSSYLYQFKFMKNYPWSEYFASRGETRKYLAEVVDRFDLKAHMHFGAELEAAEWDAATSEWVITLRDGNGTRIERFNVLISATGLFAKPKKPDIAGIDSFQGKIFHTTAWDYSTPYAGKRVAVIGTGSTGTQLMPAIASEAAYCAVFQRTPEWVMSFENYKGQISPEVHWLFDNVPYYWNWYTFSAHFTGQTMMGLQYHDRAWQAQGGKINPRNDRVRETLIDYIRKECAAKPELADKLIPAYAPLVRRLVVDNGFYKALMRDNTELVTGGIDRITPTGIVDKQGVEREFDMIVLSTGFDFSEMLWPVKYQGRDGATFAELCKKDGARSYLGATYPGFPNFFTFYGPNGSPRSGGFYSWAEIWARYIVGSIAHLIENDKSSIEVKQGVFAEYNAGMDEAMKNLIWESENQGTYYVNQFGRSGVFMPWETQEYHAMVKEPNFDDYDIR